MLNSLTKREQSLVAVIIFALGLSVLFYMYVFTPKSETIVEQQSHVDALTAANQKAANELKAGNLRQLKEDAAALPGVRLIDPARVGPTFEQLQQVRGYYSFADEGTL